MRPSWVERTSALAGHWTPRELQRRRNRTANISKSANLEIHVHQAPPQQIFSGNSSDCYGNHGPFSSTDFLYIFRSSIKTVTQQHQIMEMGGCYWMASHCYPLLSHFLETTSITFQKHLGITRPSIHELTKPTGSTGPFRPTSSFIRG